MAGILTLRLPSHRLAIGGRAIDGASTLPLEGVTVRLMSGPARFSALVRMGALQAGVAWDGLQERPDRTVTRSDGSFCFLDLPPGAYTLQAELPGGGGRYGLALAKTTVAAAGGKSPRPAIVDLTLPSSCVTGAVMAGSGPVALPVALAQVRVTGSGEQAFTDEAGRFCLAGLEPGGRRLGISAMGFERTSVEVVVIQGKIATVQVSLVPDRR